MGAYDRVTFRGKTVDKFMRQSLRKAERKLGYELTIVQGSYNAGGVSASAGTHDGGGAVDLAPYDWKRKCKVLRKLGWAAWYRPAIAGLWGAHIHAIQYDNARLSSGARNQVKQYYAGYNGLASWGEDRQWRPSPLPHFSYDVQDPDPKINLSQLQGAYLRPGGRVYNPGGRKAVRLWVKHLRKHGYTVKGFKAKVGWFGKHVTRATAKHAKNNNLPYGENGWPSWKGAKALGLRPVRPKKHKRKVKRFARTASKSVGGK